VGRQLASDLGWTFVDSDEVIERTVGRVIPEIFAEHGEETFRLLERKFLDWVVESVPSKSKPSQTAYAGVLSQKQGTVLSTGGGMPIAEGNSVLLSQIGTVIYLHAQIDILLERANRKKNRPLLNPLGQPDDARSRLKALLEARNHIYAQADINVDTSELDIC